MKKHSKHLMLSVGLWMVTCGTLFKFFPKDLLLDRVSRSFLIALLSFFYFPSALSLFGGHIGLGWGLMLASFFACAFFSLRFTTLFLLFPVPLLFVAGVLTHLGFRSFRENVKRFEITLERLDSESNLLSEREREEIAQLPALERKVERYASLSELTSLLSSSLVFKEVTALSVQKAYEVVGKSGGAFLFLIDEGEEDVSLTRSFFAKDFPGTKSKKGDLFDRWVLKHRQPLLVRDIRKDFRFNPDAIEKREIGSLIITPLLALNRVTGLLRLESLARESYTSDDLRLLSIVGDLVASSIENARLARRTEELARVDELTGLYVHRYFQERLQEEIVRSQRNRSPLSLFMVDIDHFKTYNDRYGHVAGDLVLKQVARILREEIGAGETICRYGGEEFSIILPGRGKKEALTLAEALRACVEIESFLLRQEKTHVTLSIGVASFPEDGLVKDALLKRVDDALYRAKRDGRNRVCGS